MCILATNQVDTYRRLCSQCAMKKRSSKRTLPIAMDLRYHDVCECRWKLQADWLFGTPRQSATQPRGRLRVCILAYTIHKDLPGYSCIWASYKLQGYGMAWGGCGTRPSRWPWTLLSQMIFFINIVACRRPRMAGRVEESGRRVRQTPQSGAEDLFLATAIFSIVTYICSQHSSCQFHFNCSVHMVRLSVLQTLLFG